MFILEVLMFGRCNSLQYFVFDLNHLQTSDKFIQRIVYFYPLDNTVEASSFRTTRFSLWKKIYPLGSDHWPILCKITTYTV